MAMLAREMALLAAAEGVALRPEGFLGLDLPMLRSCGDLCAAVDATVRRS